MRPTSTHLAQIIETDSYTPCIVDKWRRSMPHTRQSWTGQQSTTQREVVGAARQVDRGRAFESQQKKKGGNFESRYRGHNHVPTLI